MKSHDPGGVHLIGSVPMADAESVFRAVAGALGPHLRRLPDGETGERRRWIFFQNLMLRRHPDMEEDPTVPHFALRQWDGTLLREMALLRFRAGVDPERVRFELRENDLASYRAAAEFLNFSNVDLVCLQHEYGIFGGEAGSHILWLLRSLKMPIVTTLHTVLRDPNPQQREVMEELASLSDRLIVMSEHSSEFLRDTYHVPAEKIDLIPHGVPDLPFVDPNFYKACVGAEGKDVILTFGLLSPNK